MRIKIQQTEHRLLVAIALLLMAAILGPVVIQPAHQHDFADQRFLGYLPFAADVLSNLPFAFWGFAGLLVLPNTKLSRSMAGLAVLFFTGLIITTGASSWYHLQPDDGGLAVDRLGMTIAFAGLLGLAAADRASIRAGEMLGSLVLVFGSMCVWIWSISGNVLPWLVLQFGGMALVLWFATRPPVQSTHGTLAVRWGVVILIYALAKVFELADHAVYELTAHSISGHSLKHIIASFAAWPVISAIKQGRISSFTRIERITTKWGDAA